MRFRLPDIFGRRRIRQYRHALQVAHAETQDARDAVENWRGVAAGWEKWAGYHKGESQRLRAERDRANGLAAKSLADLKDTEARMFATIAELTEAQRDRDAAATETLRTREIELEALAIECRSLRLQRDHLQAILDGATLAVTTDDQTGGF